MTTTKHEPISSSRMNLALMPIVCKWILAAWFSVSPETMEKSFRVTGNSNGMDGSEDFMINE
jgi:hypothetical protein